MQYKLKYGVLETGRFDGTYRRDTYTPNEPNTPGGEIRPVVELTFAVDANDDSPRVQSYFTAVGEIGYRKYDPQCSQCWLGFAHTVKEHDQNIAPGAPPSLTAWRAGQPFDGEA